MGAKRPTPEIMRYDLITRWLHAAIAVTVTFQLLVSQVMKTPKPGRTIGDFEAWAFGAHEAVGLTVLGLLLLHWLWALTGHARGGPGRLLPWFSIARYRKLQGELKLLATLRIGAIAESGALVGAVHGLGLLAVSAMAATGGVIYFGMGADGSMSPLVHAVKESHEFFASFVWIFLAGHAGMAVLHQWLGHRTLSAMFRLKK